jgi:hypothetical protein
VPDAAFENEPAARSNLDFLSEDGRRYYARLIEKLKADRQH